MFRKNNIEEWLDSLKEFVDPIKITWEDGYIKGYEDAAEEFQLFPDEIYDPSHDIEESYQSGYRMGEQFGWTFVWKIAAMSNTDFAEVFEGSKYLSEVLHKYSFAEAYKLYQKWAKEHEDE